MADKINDGGSAFPRAATAAPPGLLQDKSALYLDPGTSGMSLRDFLAAQALPMCWRFAAKQEDASGHYEDIAGRASFWAYAAADAMLKARNGK
jgi:hypothetical protein